MASPVKLPVGSGIASICCRSRMYPLVVSTALISGVSCTVIVVSTSPTFRLAFTVAVRFACTRMEGTFWALKTFVSKREGVGADGKIYEVVAAIAVAGLGAGQSGFVAHEGHDGPGHDTARGLHHRAGYSAERLLRPSQRNERNQHAHEQGKKKRKGTDFISQWHG